MADGRNSMTLIERRSRRDTKLDGRDTDDTCQSVLLIWLLLLVLMRRHVRSLRRVTLLVLMLL